MLLAITKSVTLPTSVDQVWAVVRDPETVAGCLPNIKDFRPTDEPGRYATLLVERLGPFSVQVALTITVSEEPAEHRMVATIAGDDKGGAARVRGDVTATVRPDGDGATLEVASDVEVLGRMAALGAVPMRRRADQIFDQFVKNIATLLEERHA
jgi:carbon monoxide dehydrogenase subunit G